MTSRATEKYTLVQLCQKSISKVLKDMCPQVCCHQVTLGIMLLQVLLANTMHSGPIVRDWNPNQVSSMISLENYFMG